MHNLGWSDHFFVISYYHNNFFPDNHVYDETQLKPQSTQLILSKLNVFKHITKNWSNWKLEIVLLVMKTINTVLVPEAILVL